MKNGMTMEEYMAEIDAKKERAEVFKDLLAHIDNEIEWKCEKVKEADGYYEEYEDENGEPQKKWHSPVYKVDENGDYIFIEPAEGDYNYKSWKAWKGIREEILAII